MNFQRKNDVSVNNVLTDFIVYGAPTPKLL